jgi:hypothetical protein
VSRRALWCALAVSAAAAQAPQPAGSNVEIEAQLGGRNFAPHQSVPLRLTVRNRSAIPIFVPNPTTGGNSLRLHLRLPSRQMVSASGYREMPGVPPIPTPAQIPVNDQRQFDLDLIQLFPIAQAGGYSLQVEFEWKTGSIWRSAELPFTIGSAAPVFLRVEASDASRAGQHAVVWGEREAGSQTILTSTFRVQDDPIQLPPAQEIARIPDGLVPAFSTGPPRSPYPDRWVAWIYQGSLNLLYHSDTVSRRLSPRAVALRSGNASVIDPMLIDRIPDQGRPDAAAGIVGSGPRGAEFQLAEIDPAGKTQLLAPIVLGGRFLGGWATTTTSGVRFFVAAVQTAQDLQFAGISCPGAGACSSSVGLYRTNLELLAADLRPGPNSSALFGVLLKQGSIWRRITFSAGSAGIVVEPTETVLTPCQGASAVRARLDSGGGLGVVYVCNQEVFYAPSRATTASVAARPGSRVSLLDFVYLLDLPRAVLLYMAEKGLVAVDVP